MGFNSGFKGLKPISKTLYKEIIAVCSHIQTSHINTLCRQNVELLNVVHKVGGLSGKYPAILNISRTGRVALMSLGSQSEETLLRIREQSLSRGTSQSAVRRR